MLKNNDQILLSSTQLIRCICTYSYVWGDFITWLYLQTSVFGKMFLLEPLKRIVKKSLTSNKYLVLLSGFLLHCAYGSVLTFGNIKFVVTLRTSHSEIYLQTEGNVTTYITSYQRYILKLDISYADTMWIQAISFATTGVALPLGGFLEKILGPRITILISALFMR